MFFFFTTYSVMSQRKQRFTALPLEAFEAHSIILSAAAIVRVLRVVSRSRMVGGLRGLVAPQKFLENIVRRSNGRSVL